MKFTSLSFLYVLIITEAKLGSEGNPAARELESCELTNTYVNGECSYSNVKASVLASPCTEAEFFAMLGAEDEAEATATVGQMCEGADETSRENFIPWSAVTDRGYQFDKEFFNGGTFFNEDYATADAPDLLATQTARLKQIESTVLKKRGISWPSNIENFSDDSCDEPVAMCCWTADRDKVGTGSCSGTDCQDKDPVDNTDVCYFDSRDSSFAAHVIDATTVFPDDSEGPVHCHGFTFNSASETKYAGNTLFQVAMSYGLMGNGYVREIQGAPMCGCIKTMPKVTSAGCTSTTVTEKWALTKNGANKLEIKLSATDISFGECDGKTLEGEFQAKNGRSVNGNFFDKCSTEATYMAAKGYKKTGAEWIPVVGNGALYHEIKSEEDFREIWAQSPNQILRRVCPRCWGSHQDIYYRRFDENGLPEDLDLLYVVTDYWHSSPSIEHNDFNTDFKLYSTYDDAVNDKNNWTFCNFNDRNVGFPRDCGPTGWVPAQWNSWTFNAPRRNVRFYVEKA